jgi:hypothetical protein
VAQPARPLSPIIGAERSLGGAARNELLNIARAAPKNG